MNIRFIEIEEVVSLNKIIIETFSPKEQVGIKEFSLLDSAINRPKQSAFGVDAYPTLFDKAAALFDSIAKNHCFFNANKRTALGALVLFLYYNGYRFYCEQTAEQDFVVDVVNHQYTFEEISTFISQHSIPVYPNSVHEDTATYQVR